MGDFCAPMAWKMSSRSTLSQITPHWRDTTMNMICAWHLHMECLAPLIAMLDNHTLVGIQMSSLQIPKRLCCACRSSWSRVALPQEETTLTASFAVRVTPLKTCLLLTLVAWIALHGVSVVP